MFLKPFIKYFLIKNANVLKQEIFEKDDPKLSAQPAIAQNKKSVQNNNNDNIIMVDLGNGVKAKMNTTNLEKVESQ